MRADVTEKEFQAATIELAHLGGWVVAHFRVARTARGWATPVAADGKGFPDLVLVHPLRGLVVFAELKSASGRASPEQIRWGDDIGCAGGDYRLWRPSDWDEIVALIIG